MSKNAMTRVKPPLEEPKILLWDIEATGLNATFGTILCIGWKWYGKEFPVEIASILDGPKGKGATPMLDDSYVVDKFVKAFMKADYHATWYGERYDLPMIRSKLIKRGAKPLPPKPHLDLWKAVRYRFKAHNNRLATWQGFLGLEDEKTQIDFDAWLRAAHGHKASVAEVVDHCKKDVLVLEGAFTRLRPWLSNEPARHLFLPENKGACPSCGSDNTHRQGYRVTKARRYPRFQCQDCGKWWSSSQGGAGIGITMTEG